MCRHNNNLTILKFILNHQIGKIENLVVKEGIKIHGEDCYCDIISSIIKGYVEIGLEENLTNFYERNQFRFKDWKTQKVDSKAEFSFTIRNKAFKNMFHEFYNSSAFISNDSTDFSDFLFIYKAPNLEELKYNFVEKGKTHKFCSENESVIDKGLLLKKYGKYRWKVVASGCSCSTIQPLEPDYIGDNFIDNIFLENSVSLNE